MAYDNERDPQVLRGRMLSSIDNESSMGMGLKTIQELLEKETGRQELTFNWRRSVGRKGRK